MKDAKNKALKNKKEPRKYEQISKEHIGGKWQKAGFYKDKKGKMKVEPFKE